MKQIIEGILIAITSLVVTAHAQLTLTGVTMYGATDSGGDWNGSYDYWDTLGGNFAFNVYLFTGSTNSPNFLNSGDSDASLNPNLVLSPGTFTIQFAVDVHSWDPSTPYLGMDLYFNSDSVTNRISAVVPNGGACDFSVVGDTASTYGQGATTPGSGALSYTAGDFKVTLSDFCTFPNTPNLVSGYNNVPGSESDFIGSFTLTVTPAQPAISIGPAVELSWPSFTNYTYQVQWCTNLTGSNWFNLGVPIQGDGTINYLFDSAVGSQRFYRVTLVQ